MSTRHEEYIFFQECLMSLNVAWAIVDALGEDRVREILRESAFRMALIEYAKPYKQSRGIEVKKHVLPLPKLDVADQKLHSEILHIRDTSLAHSDLTVKGAKLYVGHIGSTPFPLIIQNTGPSLPPLVAVRGLIKRSLDELYSQLPVWEAQLE